jgi:hypothetical protein
MKKASAREKRKRINAQGQTQWYGIHRTAKRIRLSKWSG